MYPNICQIYGNLYFNCYGFAIAIGLIIFSILIQKNSKFNELITFDKFANAMLVCIITAIVGGRLLWIFEDINSIKNWYEIFALWEPGYSFLGSLIGILIILPLFLKKNNIQILPFLDLVAIYAPLLHSISRIGCFLAGCCHGVQTNLPWGIVYTHPDVAVPDYLKFIKIHPTQIYASITLFLIFLVMYYIFQNKFKIAGQLASSYLILSSIERFFNDFLRADRDIYNYFLINTFSLHQWISILICLLGVTLFIYITYYKTSFTKNYANP